MKIFLLIFLSLYSPFEKVPKFFEEKYCTPNIYEEEEYNLLCGHEKYFKAYSIENSKELIVITSKFHLQKKLFIINEKLEIKEMPSNILKTNMLPYENYKLIYNAGSLEFVQYQLNYENGKFSITEKKGGISKVLFSFDYKKDNELLYDFYCDGERFVILVREEDAIDRKSENVIIIWGNFKKINIQEIVFPLSYAAALENDYFNENNFPPIFNGIIFDPNSFSKDPKGI